MQFDFMEKTKTKQFRYIATAAAVVLIVVFVIIVKGYADNRTYSSYEVVKSVKKSDSVSKYAYTDGYVVRYSIDGAALIKSNLDTVWNQPYAMLDPRIDICNGHILLYDRLGTAIHIFNKRGQVSSFAAPSPILNARICTDHPQKTTANNIMSQILAESFHHPQRL